MNLTSVEKIKEGWKIQYESKATDGIPVTVKYPSFNDIGLGKPTREFHQAIAPFLRFAIAISHLDKAYWLQHGSVIAIKIKEGNDDQMLQVKVEAEDKEGFAHAKITTHWIEFSSLMSILQATDPKADSVNLAVENLEEEVEKYVNGDRLVVQGELFTSDEVEKVSVAIA